MLAFFFGVIMKIIKISAYLDKVRKLQIEDPLLLLTTYLDDNYFKLIDWNKTKDQNSLLTEINNAINKMSSNINEDWKKILFSPEIKHNFHQSVPFIYIVLTTISNKTKNIDDVVLEQLYEKLKTQKELSSKKILKIYEDIYAKKEKGISTTEDLDFDFILKGYTGWLLIPGKITPDTVKYQEDARNLSTSFENYNNREMLLRHVSCGTGWCTGQGMENEYLPRGDFWKYMVNGKAKASIRFDDDQIAEMQGLNNNNTNAYIYADAYMALAQKYPELGIQNVEDRNYGLTYGKLLEGKEKVKYYSQAPIEEIIKNINEAFYYLTDSVIEQNKNNELFNNAIIDIFTKIGSNEFISNINRFSYLKKNDKIRERAKVIGDSFADYEKMLELNQLFDNELYNKEEIELEEEIYIIGIEELLRTRVPQYEEIPDWVKEKYPERMEKAHIQGWENLLKTNPFWYLKIPDQIKEKYAERLEEAHIKGWKDLLERHPSWYLKIPDWVKEKYSTLKEVYLSAWESQLKRNLVFYDSVPNWAKQKYPEIFDKYNPNKQLSSKNMNWYKKYGKKYEF